MKTYEVFYYDVGILLVKVLGAEYFCKGVSFKYVHKYSFVRDQLEVLRINII